MSENVLSVEKKRVCNVCESVSKLKRCNRCKIVLYCSRDHQKQDWPNHKNVCTIPQTESPSSEEKSPDTQNHDSVIRNEQQAEIESILNFDSIRDTPLPENNSRLQQSKEIFTDLLNRESDEYMGPSDDAIISAVEDMVLSPVQQPSRTVSKNQDSNIPLEVYNEEDFEGPSKGEGVKVKEEDYVPFDSRPLRKLKFPLPDSYNHSDLGEFIGLRLISLGYCVIDNVFAEEEIDGLISEIKRLDADNELNIGQLGWSKTDGEDDNTAGIGVHNDKVKWVQGDEDGFSHVEKAMTVLDSIMQFVSRHLKVKEYGNIQGRSKAMLTCYPDNSSYCRQRIDNSNKDGRRITCILYLNKDLDLETDGGLLRLLPPSQEKQVDIPPKANRLLYFWSDKRNPYEVHPVYRERLSMTIWYFDSDERTVSKVENLKAETEEINRKIAELEEKEATRLQQIQNKAMDSVKALSEEELQALSVLLHTHPRPRQALTAMGISTHIQDALIQYLTNL